MSDVLRGIPDEKLSTAEEDLCALAADENSHERLIMHNLREAFVYARGCFPTGLDDGAILSAVYDGLRAAVGRFSPGRIRFFAYAKADVRGHVIKAFRAGDVVRKVKAPACPLPEPETPEDYPSDELPCPKTSTESLHPEGIQEPEFERIFLHEEWQQLAPVLREVLNDKERMVLELHFQGNLNLQEICRMLRTSRSDTHHTKQVALKKIRHYLIDNDRFHKHF